MTEVKDKKIRTKSGVVVSSKMDKTIVVKVVRKKAHPLYGKQISITKKYKVHDPENRYKEGDKVSFVETRPISKDKKWLVLYK